MTHKGPPQPLNKHKIPFSSHSLPTISSLEIFMHSANDKIYELHEQSARRMEKTFGQLVENADVLATCRQADFYFLLC